MDILYSHGCKEIGRGGRQRTDERQFTDAGVGIHTVVAAAMRTARVRRAVVDVRPTILVWSKHVTSQHQQQQTVRSYITTQNYRTSKNLTKKRKL